MEMPAEFTPPFDASIGYFLQFFLPANAVILGVAAIVIEAIVLRQALPGLGMRALRDSFVMNLTTTALGFLAGVILPSIILFWIGEWLGPGHEFGEPNDIRSAVLTLITFTIIVGIPSVWLEGALLRCLEPYSPSRRVWGATVLANAWSHLAVYTFYFVFWYVLY